MNIISLLTKWLPYSVGFLGLFLLNNATLTMLIYRYDPGSTNSGSLPSLIPSAIVGLAMFFCRSSGAMTQPFIGYFSDRYWSRWGRRKPFLALAVLPFVASFILLFIPPFDFSLFFHITYLVLVLGLFYLAMACYQVPYLAWLTTLAQTAEQRVELSSLMAIGGLLGTAIGGIGAPWLVQELGFSQMAIAMGSGGFIALLMPLVVPEDVTSIPQTKVNSSLFKSFKVRWQSPAFKSYMISVTLAWIGASIISTAPTYVAVALLRRNVSFGSVVNAIVFLSAIAGAIIVMKFTKGWGKKRAFQFSMTWLGCGLIIIGVASILLGTKIIPWSILLLAAHFGLGGFFILPNAMLPDVIEWDAQKFGDREEAIYFGIRGLLVEMSIAIGFFLAGVLLMLGKTPVEPWGVRLTFPVAGIFALMAAWMFKFYPIKK